MLRGIHDLRGRRFGRLVVLVDGEPEVRNRNAYWPCVCDCGTRKVLRGCDLLRGATVSCGCQRTDPAVRRTAARKGSKL